MNCVWLLVFMSTCLEDEYRAFNSTHGSIVYWVSSLSRRRDYEGCWGSTFSFYLCAVSTPWHTLSDHILCNDFWTHSSRNNTPVIQRKHAPEVCCKHKKRFILTRRELQGLSDWDHEKSQPRGYLANIWKHLL